MGRLARLRPTALGDCQRVLSSKKTATYRGVEAHFSLVKGVLEPNVSRHRSSDTRFQQTEKRSARENLGVSGGASFLAVMHESGIVPASLCSARTHFHASYFDY